ncbi:hypothetical protein LX32DRAFT_333855 [Colletotrichum zoysiae]|uniref:Uncharacterized protein n=1 Tax=Colletotrichum zoysiae TaxID=1216348 RepID=A0AAD9HLK2_9PEZI|nr:hypothetical protein LX32DRAFT_333855 [Colletotrichum zoysiae]
MSCVAFCAACHVCTSVRTSLSTGQACIRGGSIARSSRYLALLCIPKYLHTDTLLKYHQIPSESWPSRRSRRGRPTDPDDRHGRRRERTG